MIRTVSFWVIMQHNDPEERGSRLLRSGSLKSYKVKGEVSGCDSHSWIEKDSNDMVYYAVFNHKQSKIFGEVTFPCSAVT
jgi:hypothetical protein